MTLITSISGIRGTIGGKPGNSLTPVDIVRFAAAYAGFIKKRSRKEHPVIIIGRDARISGDMVNDIVVGTLLSMGVDIIDLGLSTTPTVEMAVPDAVADGGIILTASHNPKEWNAMKLLNEKGEFINEEEGREVLRIAREQDFTFAGVDDLGIYEFEEEYITAHIEEILKLPLVDKQAIENAGFRVAIDCVNSTGGIAVPELLLALGVTQIDEIYCEPNGEFPHNPEPLPENLGDICRYVVDNKADVGFVVDPDVDRLAIVCEDGSLFGEEYTLVAVADYVLQNNPGNTVSNLSSTMALRDVTMKYGGTYYASAVGEVNVVEKMKEVKAVIGGEGNGGIFQADTKTSRWQ